MAAVLGNLALLLEATSPPPVTNDRKPRQVVAVDVLLNFLKRDSISCNAVISNTSYESEGATPTRNPNRNPRILIRGKSNFTINAIGFDALSDDDDGDDDSESEDEKKPFEWEEEMRRRVKELEEAKELEMKAEELQSELDDEERDGIEENEEEKRSRVRKELEKVAQEQAERRAVAQLMFDLGQKAYGKGMYGRSIEFLEGALTIIPRSTIFGGEIQIWLAMAYEANRRHRDCIALYLQLEKRHPSASIRRQAADLRYILQAPKLKISREEMVTIPLIGSSYDSYAVTWTDKYKDRDERRSQVTTINQLPWRKDYLEELLTWKPPVGWEKNRAFWAAFTLWLGLVGAALFRQQR